MTKWCAVPNCRTGSRTENKCSVFRAPRDAAQFKKWEEAIPGVVKLNPTDVVCEKHFDAVDIAREWIKFGVDGQVIARVPYKIPHLQKHAVPTRFGDVSTKKENSAPLNEYVKESSLLQNKSLIIQNRCNPVISASNNIVSVFRPTQRKSINIGVSLSAMEVPSCSSLKAVSLSPEEKSDCDHKYVKLDLHLQENPPSLDIKPKRKAIANADFSAYVPELWSYGKIRSDLVYRTVFSYTITKIENGVSCPVTQKSVVLDADGTLQYFIYGHAVDLTDTKLERVLTEEEMLPNVLNKFRGMNVCSGLGDVDFNLVSAKSAYQDYVDTWRSRSCTLLSKKKRCDPCLKLKKKILQGAARLKSRTPINRVGRIANPVIQRKVSALRAKIRRERRKKLRAKDRVECLMGCLKTKEAEIARMHDTTLDTILARLEIPASQKLVLEEIVAAAKKTDARGRRYTHEWIMLCMLMSIRSPKDYEFLRKNAILPLPCTRTIRSYFSLIEAKCGFDAKFT